MGTITVVRIEQHGQGIFLPLDRSICDYSLTKRVYSRHNADFPIPYFDGLDVYKDDKEWFCAYKTIEQFQEWIKQDELEHFIHHGFRVYMIEVKEYQVGEKQVIFLKEGIVSKIDITETFI